MNAQELQLVDWIIGSFGTDARTAAILACSYSPEELDDMDYIKEELVSWRNTHDILLAQGIFKKK